MKAFVIGIDGATFNLIKPWAEAGHLPNLARLMATGTHGELMSTLPSRHQPSLADLHDRLQPRQTWRL